MDLENVKDLVNEKDLVAVMDIERLSKLSIRDQAMYFYDLGFNTFPIFRGTKIPSLAVMRGYQYMRLPRYAINFEFEKTNIGVMTGRTSNNLFVVDCDNQDTFDEVFSKLEALDLAKWVYRTPHGGHFWFLSEEGEVRNHVGEGLQIWGQKQYVTIPPSVNQEGELYYWVRLKGNYPPALTSKKIFDLFDEKLKVTSQMVDGIPAITHRVLVLGQSFGYSTNSEAEHAAVCALVRCGYSDDFIFYLFEKYAPPHYQKNKNRKEALYKYSILPARELIPVEPYQDDINNLLVRSFTYTWSHKTDSTDRLVFIALCERAHYQGIKKFRATIREISELTNLGVDTVIHSIRRLLLLGVIEFISYESGKYYKINKHVLLPNNDGTGHNINGGNLFTLIKHDVWQPRALGKPSLNLVMILLQFPEGKEKKELATLANRNVRTIEKPLEKLTREGLVTCNQNIYQYVNLTQTKLDDIARKYGSLGRNNERKTVHEKQRQEYMYWISKRVER